MSAEPSELDHDGAYAHPLAVGAEPSFVPGGHPLAPRTPLRVLQGWSTGSERQSDRRYKMAAVAIVILAALGVAISQALLDQGQFRLASLHAQQVAAQAQQEALTYEVATLDSPQRITYLAEKRYHLAVPPGVTYLRAVRGPSSATAR